MRRRHCRHRCRTPDVRSGAARHRNECPQRTLAMARRSRRDVHADRDDSRRPALYPQAVPWLVGLAITAAYWFTSSTSFANPAVTLARGFTTTFAGIAMNHVPGFVAARLVGAAVALPVCSVLFPAEVRSGACRQE